MAEEDQDLSHIHWSWPEAIAANPARSLATADLAMDYFAYSPFFDSKSNNSVLRTQRRVENPAYGHAEEKAELNAFRSGFEYIVSHSQPPNLFVIQRRDVAQDGSRDKISGMYFILHDKIYPTPTLYAVMAARLKNASHLISTTFDAFSTSHPAANPRAMDSWRSLPPSAAPQDTGDIAPARDGEQGEDVDMTAGGEGSGQAGIAPAGDAGPARSTGTGVEGKPTKGKSKGKQPAQPDWFLFNALRSTQQSMAELERSAEFEQAAADDRAELKAIEAEIYGAGAASRGASRVRIAAANTGGSQPAMRGLAGTPSGYQGSSPLATMGPIGRSPSVMAQD